MTKQTLPNTMPTTRVRPSIRPTWEQDYQDRINPKLISALLRRSVPVLEASDWNITEVEEGFTKSVLPLNVPTTNQHGTHQAALISLSADYTGGIAMASLLRGVPLSGIHQCEAEDSVSLWLASMNVKYKSPSSGHLTGTCRIDEKKAAMITERYFRGDRVLAALDVEFHSNGDLVAIAEMKYFAQPTIQLTPEPGSNNRSTLFSHKLKASARMIAGIRSRLSDNPTLTVECPDAPIAAGPHGEMLAARCQLALPQLTDMVLARTQHIDEVCLRHPNLKQVVMLGAGLDLRPLRLLPQRPELKFFELDLPEMLTERARVIEMLDRSFHENRFSVTADFRADDIVTLLGSHPDFHPDQPTLFISEGCSMYFTDQENRRMMSMVSELMQNPESQLWIDLVHSDVVEGKANNDSMELFLEGMKEMGEAFIFGTADGNAWLKNCGFQSVNSTTCREYLEESLPVFDTYSFHVASGRQ